MLASIRRPFQVSVPPGASNSSWRTASGGEIGNSPACSAIFSGQANKRPELTRVFTQFSTRTSADRVRPRSRARQDARRVDLEHLFHAADVPRRQLHQRLQSVRPHLQGHRPGGGRRARRARFGQWLVCAHRTGRHGAAVDSGDDQAKSRAPNTSSVTTSSGR